MRYAIRTAISHGHIKQQITTVGSHGCLIKECVISLVYECSNITYTCKKTLKTTVVKINEQTGIILIF